MDSKYININIEFDTPLRDTIKRYEKDFIAAQKTYEEYRDYVKNEIIEDIKTSRDAKIENKYLPYGYAKFEDLGRKLRFLLAPDRQHLNKKEYDEKIKSLALIYLGYDLGLHVESLRDLSQEYMSGTLLRRGDNIYV